MDDPIIDLREAFNAISDVVQNRPRPLRQFDQIYMRAGDMLMQSEFVAAWSRDRKLAFIGDGDSISVSVAYLAARGILPYGPSKITVFDFDERIVGAINRFADAERLENLEAVAYNCLSAVPSVEKFDAFYTNPPWGASNGGESVNLFMQRGMELIGYNGDGVVVIADYTEELPWTGHVLANVQAFAVERGFYVSRMMQRLHSYHLDDNPELRSCNLLVKSRPGETPSPPSIDVSETSDRLNNFYGDGVRPSVRYVRERERVDYGRAHESEYELELFGGEK